MKSKNIYLDFYMFKMFNMKNNFIFIEYHDWGVI